MTYKKEIARIEVCKSLIEKLSENVLESKHLICEISDQIDGEIRIHEMDEIKEHTYNMMKKIEDLSEEIHVIGERIERFEKLFNEIQCVYGSPDLDW